MSNEQNEEEVVDFVVDDLGIDLSDASAYPGWDGSVGPRLAPGEYLVEVVNVKVETNKRGDGRNLVLDYKVLTEGDYADQKVKQWLALPTADSKAGVIKRFAHVVRDVLETPMLPGGGFQTMSMIGKKLYITAVLEESKDFDPTRGTEVTKTNLRLQNERRYEEPEAAPPPARTTQAPPSKPPATAAKGKPVASAPARR